MNTKLNNEDLMILLLQLRGTMSRAAVHVHLAQSLAAIETQAFVFQML